MLRPLIIATALCLGSVPPAHAQPPAATDASLVVAAQQEYAAWVTRAMAIYSPVQARLHALQSAHAQEQGLPLARRAALLRPRAAEFLGLVAEAEAGLVRLDQPSFDQLGVSPELQPRALVTELRDALSLVRSAVGSMVETLDHAAAGRVEALERAADRFSATVNGLNRAQLRFAQARMMSVARDDPFHYIIGIEVSSQRLSQMLLANSSLDALTPATRRNMAALADELDGWMVSGRAAVAQLEEMVAGVSAPSGSAPATLLARTRGLIPLQRAQMDTGEEFAALVRTIAGDSRPGFRSRLSGYMLEAHALLTRLAQTDQQAAVLLATQ